MTHSNDGRGSGDSEDDLLAFVEEDFSDQDGETVVHAVESAPTGPIEVRYFGLTDVGLIREHNEDNFLVANLESGQVGLPTGVVEAAVQGRGLVLAVCDGMGGAAAGEVASQMAVDTLYEMLAGGARARDRDEFARRLVHAVEESGSRIFSEAKMDRTRRGMGTTATVAGLIDSVLFVGQVGDSRAYLLRQGELALVTKDQSLVNQLIEAGQLTEEEAEAFEHSNIILQALGTTEDVVVDLTFVELRQGDRLMLCSDGLSGLVHEQMIRETMSAVHEIPACCERLIELAKNGGGHDNITVIVADFSGPGLAPGEAAARAGYFQYPLPPMDENTPAYGLSHRELHIKSEPPKPGSDVKGAPPPPLPMVPAAVREPRSFSWAMVGLVFVLACAGIVGLLLMRPNAGSTTVPWVPDAAVMSPPMVIPDAAVLPPVAIPDAEVVPLAIPDASVEDEPSTPDADVLVVDEFPVEPVRDFEETPVGVDLPVRLGDRPVARPDRPGMNTMRPPPGMGQTRPRMNPPVMTNVNTPPPNPFGP